MGCFPRMLLFIESVPFVFKICLTEAKSTIKYIFPRAKIIMLYLHEGLFEESI